jgi:hypothetical protein
MSGNLCNKSCAACTKKILSMCSIKTALLLLFICFSSMASSQVVFNSGNFRLAINNSGVITDLNNTTTNKNHLYKDSISPLITLLSGNKRYVPSSITYNKSQHKITLLFKLAGITIDVIVIEKNSHIVFEIIKAIPANKIEAIVWGPLSTSINKTVGEVIGVVRDGETTIGLQVLNIKTLGGDMPNNEGSTWARGIAAKQYAWGSSLQAYSINRELPRFVDAWGGQQKNMPVPIMKGETVVGSKIALFSCKESETLDRLEQIELAENLPHPTINGVWFKKSPLFGKSYLISSFGENEVDEMIGYTKRAGLISLYHEGPFQSWGHFILDSTQFPNGKEGLKKSVGKAHAAGLRYGVHTLTNFINTNDPYITPIPDDRLSLTGSSKLVFDVNAQQNEIEVASPDFFNEQKNNSLHTVKIGKELIRYKSVSEIAPFKLLDCQRGAFGTTAAAHKKDDVVGKLFDHAYNVFFPNLDMQREVAMNLANLMNETGVDHLDFDGHEGGLASGQGDYGIDLFSKDVFDHVKHEFICGTSLSKTFYWHIGSYYNWGEPWYGGFKESMQQYRIDNQGLFERNYMPHMLGWYLLAENTTLAEMEWMLARAAGYNAGFAMVARPKSVRNNPRALTLLDAIREWETARNENAFSTAHQELLKDPKNEFHLEKISDGKWNLYQYAMSNVFIREKFDRQPGEPVHTSWNFQQGWKEQPLQFRLNVTGTEGAVNNIKIQVDSYAEIILPIELLAGESLVCDGTDLIRMYDKNGKPKGKYLMKSAPPLLAPGSHNIISDCSFKGEEPPKIEVQFKGMDKMEIIQSQLK